jgi:hypothetical protein
VTKSSSDKFNSSALFGLSKHSICFLSTSNSSWLVKIYPALFTKSVDFILNKIRVPFHFLENSLRLPRNDIQTCLNVYWVEMCHALNFAEKRAVFPLEKIYRWKNHQNKTDVFLMFHRVRKGIIPRWLTNSDLMTSCSEAKLRFVWKECGRPNSEIINSIRVSTKRKFSKLLPVYGKNR